MTGLEIALFIIGIAFVIISFFIVDNNEKKAAENVVSDISPELEEKVVEKISNAADKTAEMVISETDNRLSVLSNDKIIAVSEFSDQVLEKINSNHQEVVFLYQMLKDKEEELKKTAQQLDRVRIDCEKLLMQSRSGDEAEPLLSKPDVTGESDTIVKQNTAKSINEENEGKAEPGSKSRRVKSESDSRAGSQAVTRTERNTTRKRTGVNADRKGMPSPERIDAMISSKNEEILALHKKKKSIMEISKLLGMGQGEVKLIIDLYGK